MTLSSGTSPRSHDLALLPRHGERPALGAVRQLALLDRPVASLAMACAPGKVEDDRLRVRQGHRCLVSKELHRVHARPPTDYFDRAPPNFDRQVIGNGNRN